MNLNQVTIPTTNMPKSVDFYTRLGLTLIVDSIPRYCRFVCPDGTSTLSLHEAERTSTENGIVLYFECKDLDNTIQDLKTKGCVFETEATDQSWLWREASILDPDGHKIILFYAGENRINPPWKVK
jgi:catechol 2,3-dioxygenase-like lactoylglutathione lyase family enzyme